MGQEYDEGNICSTFLETTPELHRCELEGSSRVELRKFEIEEFAESVPGFFASRAVPDATSDPWSGDQPTTEPILGSRLYDLLKTCIPGTSPLAEEKRKNRLRVCLKSLWYCERAYNQPENSEPLITLLRPRRLRQSRDDPSNSGGRGPRCACHGALFWGVGREEAFSRHYLALRSDQRRDTGVPIGYPWHRQPGAIELASVVSFMLVADSFVSDTMLPDMFKQTLRIHSQTLLTKEQADLPLPQIAVPRNTFQGSRLAQRRAAADIV
ncbi:hypothetical protein EDB85DRAFT_2294382 [Lactarius pseudohatsudake]|nr:hypothetical protein EDB85DRAFT_2294382 [Lactarius pseudohatsudake]